MIKYIKIKFVFFFQEKNKYFFNKLKNGKINKNHEKIQKKKNIKIIKKELNKP